MGRAVHHHRCSSHPTRNRTRAKSPTFSGDFSPGFDSRLLQSQQPPCAGNRSPELLQDAAKYNTSLNNNSRFSDYAAHNSCRDQPDTQSLSLLSLPSRYAIPIPIALTAPPSNPLPPSRPCSSVSRELSPLASEKETMPFPNNPLRRDVMDLGMPSTPPAMMATSHFNGRYNMHVRADSSSSNNSSPDSVVTNLTTPNLSPVIRQHGPALLPKIRPQDLIVEPVSSSGPIRHRKGQSTIRKPTVYTPYPASRSQMLSQDCHPISTVTSSRLSPSSEGALAELVRDIYAPRVNAAIQTSIGKGLILKPTTEAFLTGNRTNSGPHFIANYATDTELTASGSQRGRLVGLIKSFNCWNSGMRQEPPHKRVEYLNGLAHLQRCMREHSCRYGFIMTEIELVCVRAGYDDVTDTPYFGYLQVAPPIMTNLSSESYSPPPQHQPRHHSHSRSHRSSSAQSSDYSPTPSRSPSPPSSFTPQSSTSTPLTATLALYYLVLLSKAEALPTQPRGYLNVSGQGTLTRQHILPEGKDKWIPEPQTGEKRDAKRVRGWVWPQDPWHRREGVASGSRAKAHQQNQQLNGSGKVAGKGKKWHK
ncbi:hypothetical protein I7I51_01936 [Histoplasma capsulatum]|uniref:Sialidase n=1 Tax=Ajellomyces capsulatus TaxID=5037 RepID=A0A8A1MJX3_AJECA|nr:hypothetical protein I7I51_01936 [Histoplasma capsulatum]